MNTHTQGYEYADSVAGHLKKRVEDTIKFLKQGGLTSNASATVQQVNLDMQNFEFTAAEILLYLLCFDNDENKLPINDQVPDINPYDKIFPNLGLELDSKREFVKFEGSDVKIEIQAPDLLKLDESNVWTAWNKYDTFFYSKRLNVMQLIIVQSGGKYSIADDSLSFNKHLKQKNPKKFEKYKHFNDGESHKGRNCGKGFDLGQPIYRCQECGMDDTCVLCYRCFNPEDHINHNVMVLSTTEKTSGICDCGDHDAWKNNLNCKADFNCPDYETDPNFKEDVDYFRNQRSYYEYLLSSFLDYFIEIFMSNQLLLPHLTPLYENEYNHITLEDTANLSIETDDKTRNIPNGYFLILFNDEYHTFSHVDAVLSDLGFNVEECSNISSDIDYKGFSIISGPESFEYLYEIAGDYEEQQFTVRIVTWNALVQMNLCAGIIKGIKHCLELKNPIFQKEFRLALTTVLIKSSEASDKHYLEPPSDTYDCSEAYYNLLDKRGFDIQLNDIKIGLPTDLTLDCKCEYKGHENVSYYNPIQMSKKSRDNTSRLQSILLLDVKLWKLLRQEIAQLYLSVLATNDAYKNIIADQYAEIYAALLDIVAYLDREPQLTLMKECTTQMFSNRSIVDHLASNDGFSKIIWAAVTIFDDFCTRNDGFFLFKKPIVFNASKGFHVAFKQSLYALETIISNVDTLEKVLQPDCLFGIFCLLQRFNGAYKLRRKKGEHVLREDQFFITYVEYSMSLYTIVNSINKLLSNSSFSSYMQESVLMFLAHFNHLRNEFIEYKLENGQVVQILEKLPHVDRVSYMNPLHTLLGTLLTYYPFEKIQGLFQNGNLLMSVADDPMMTLSLHSQASVGLWVRNGLSVVHQLQFYRDQLRSSAYLIDIYFNQLAVILNPLQGLASFFYKWGFLKADDFAFSINNIEYDDKNENMLFNMISNLYLIISERNRFLPTSSNNRREEELFRANIVYVLLNPPIKYSQLSELLNDHPLYFTLDTVLNEVADYKAPKGINGEGTFSLKKEIYREIDMINVFGSGFGGFATVETVSKVIGSKNNDGFVIEPKLRKYEDLQNGVLKFSSFADEPLFAQCIEECLANASAKLSLDLSLNILHLIHGVILDNRLFYQDETFIPNNLKSNKIYNNLFKLGFILDSNKFVKSKAIAVFKLFMASESTYIMNHLRASFFIDNLEERLDELAGRRKSFIENQENSTAQKKLLIKKRQDALLSKFKKNQAKFLQTQSSEGLESSHDYEMQHVDEEKTIICSSCQETNNDDIFVVPCFFDNTPAIRPLNVNGDFKNQWKDSRNDDSNYYMASASTSTGGDYGFDKAAVSCNHPIHLSCLKGYLIQSGINDFGHSFKYFSCPVCQNLSDCVVPMFNNHLPLQNNELVDLFTNKLIPENSLNLDHDDEKLKFINKNIMLQFFLRSGYTGSDLTAEEISAVDNNYVMFALSNTLANSISMIEVSSRLSDEPYLDFLNFNERQYKTLKLLGEAISSYRENNEHLGFNFFASNNIANANRGFQYIVDRYFLSEDSIETSLIFAFNEIYEKSFYLVAAKLENAERLETKCDIDKLYHLKKYNYARPKLLDIVFIQDEDVKHHKGSYSKVFEVLFGTRDNYFYSSSNSSIKGNTHLSQNERLELLKSMCYTLALEQFKVLLRKTIIFMKMLNLYGTKNAENIDTINGQRLNDGTDPSIFEYDDEKYCDYLITKISNAKYTSIATFVFEGKAFCKHDHAMMSSMKTLDGIKVPLNNNYMHQAKCHLANCYYAKFYFNFFVGEDTGLIKLLDLKHALNDYLIRKKEIVFNPYTSDHGSNRLLVDSINYEICLECGGEVFQLSDVESLEPEALSTTCLRRHYNNKCKNLYSTGSRFSSLILNPVTNHLQTVMAYQSLEPWVMSMFILGSGTAPYLNKHGECSVDAIKANSTPVFLNKERYDNLNQKWLNLEISGDVIRHVGIDTMKNLNHHYNIKNEKREYNEVDLYSLYLGTDDLAYTNMMHMVAHSATITPLEIRQLMFFNVFEDEMVTAERKIMMDAIFDQMQDSPKRRKLESTIKIPALAFHLHNRLVYANEKYSKKCDSRDFYSGPDHTQFNMMTKTGDFSTYKIDYKDNLNLLILLDYYSSYVRI